MGGDGRGGGGRQRDQSEDPSEIPQEGENEPSQASRHVQGVDVGVALRVQPKLSCALQSRRREHSSATTSDARTSHCWSTSLSSILASASICIMKTSMETCSPLLTPFVLLLYRRTAYGEAGPEMQVLAKTMAKAMAMTDGSKAFWRYTPTSSAIWREWTEIARLLRRVLFVLQQAPVTLEESQQRRSQTIQSLCELVVREPGPRGGKAARRRERGQG